MRLSYRNIVILACCLLWGAAGFFPCAHAADAVEAPKEAPFLALYPQREFFLRAIAASMSHPAIEKQRVSGLTVPHHLLAVDLIARGFAHIRTQRYSRIILLSPDHYRRGATPVSVPSTDFRTCFGPVPLDREGASSLLGSPLVSSSRLFSQEHGVQALLPFLAAHFPDVPVLPLALRITMRKEELDDFRRSLEPLLGPDTLLIQSTDFSHYLTWEEARVKDAETLRVLASGDPDVLFSLHQPHHLDSKAAQYLQMRLQKEYYSASPTVLVTANSCEYQQPGDPPERETTSYMVHIYSAEPVPLPGGLRKE